MCSPVMKQQSVTRSYLLDLYPETLTSLKGRLELPHKPFRVVSLGAGQFEERMRVRSINCEIGCTWLLTKGQLSTSDSSSHNMITTETTNRHQVSSVVDPTPAAPSHMLTDALILASTHFILISPKLKSLQMQTQHTVSPSDNWHKSGSFIWIFQTKMKRNEIHPQQTQSHKASTPQ